MQLYTLQDFEAKSVSKSQCLDIVVERRGIWKWTIHQCLIVMNTLIVLISQRALVPKKKEGSQKVKWADIDWLSQVGNYT